MEEGNGRGPRVQFNTHNEIPSSRRPRSILSHRSLQESSDGMNARLLLLLYRLWVGGGTSLPLCAKGYFLKDMSHRNRQGSFLSDL